MIDIDISDKKEQRKFGVVVGAAFLLFAGIRWVLHALVRGEAGFIPSYFLTAGAVLIVLGVVWPRGLKPVFYLWIKLAIVLNWVMTHLFLTLAFYLLFTPGAVLIRLFGDDPLKRKFLPEASTYWEAPEEQPAEFDRYKQQF